MIDYGDGIIESDILSDGDDSSSELVPSELLTEAAFGFMAAILGGEDVTVGMTMGDTERLRSGFVASRILVVGGGGGGVSGPQIDITAAAGGLEDGVGEGGPESVVAADAVRR